MKQTYAGFDGKFFEQGIAVAIASTGGSGTGTLFPDRCISVQGQFQGTQFHAHFSFSLTVRCCYNRYSRLLVNGSN